MPYIQFAQGRRKTQDRYDWSISDPQEGTFRIENDKHLSPSNEVGKLLKYMISNFTPHHLLALVGAMMFDVKVIILATTPEVLGQTAFGILGLIWPLAWPGTFIPILPKKLETVLEMPFGSIIGVHSTLCTKLIDEKFGAYFVINADTHDGSSVGMPDFPEEMVQQLDAVAGEIKDLIRSYRGVFPAAEIQRKIKEFICRVLGALYQTDWKSPRQLYDVFLTKRESVPTEDDFSCLISQSQFVDTMFREALEEQNYEILESLWPNYDVSESHGIDMLRTTPVAATAKFGLTTITNPGKHLDLKMSEFDVDIVGQPLDSDAKPVSDAEWERMIHE
jgi:hypothetical protein